jgi:hypothetical protein
MYEMFKKYKNNVFYHTKVWWLKSFMYFCTEIVIKTVTNLIKTFKKQRKNDRKFNDTISDGYATQEREHLQTLQEIEEGEQAGDIMAHLSVHRQRFDDFTCTGGEHYPRE